MPGESVDVLPGVTLDGNSDPVAGADPTMTIPDCLVDPVGSVQHKVRGRDGVFTKIRVYITAPLSRPIKRTDDLMVRGKRFHVDGDVSVWSDPDMATVVVEAYRPEG